VRPTGKVAIAALAGAAVLVIAPLLVRPTSKGTLSITDAAGPAAEFVDVDGLRVHVERAAYSGQADRAPLFVLLHGFGASTFTWREVLARLSAHGDVLAYDRPGFGFTERPEVWTGENPYGAEGNLRLLAALLEREGDGREVILLGHSAGGQLAAEFARRHPSSVSRLVLISPAIYTAGGGPEWLAPVLRSPQLNRLGPRLLGAIMPLTERVLDRSFVDPSRLTDAVREGYRRPLEVAGWERGLWRFVTAPRVRDLVPHLGGVRSPTLVITGDADTVIATAQSERVAGVLPDAELVVIAHTGHLSHEEAPDAVIDAITRWLGAGPAAPPHSSG
jgi:pimeloyl-ACP methyl ester carboxylesterase